MVSTHGIASAATYYENTIKQKKDSTVKTQNNKALGQAAKSSEEKLSTKAKNYLDSLRKNYGDYNFIIADEGDDRRALLGKSDKEFSIIFSSDELEKMASDEEELIEKIGNVDWNKVSGVNVGARFDFMV